MREEKAKKSAVGFEPRNHYFLTLRNPVGARNRMPGEAHMRNTKLVGKEKGFTLLELMIVIAIIGLLIAVVIPDLMAVKREGEVRACVSSLQGLQASLELYYTHYKYYPDSMQTLVQEGYLGEAGLKDPWSKSYRYALVAGSGGASDEEQGAGTANNYLLGSEGPDGRQDTVDDVEAPMNKERHSFKKTGTEPGAGTEIGLDNPDGPTY